MTNLKVLLTIGLFSSLAAGTAFADPSTMVSLSSKTHKLCTAKKPCVIKQQKLKKSYSISFHFKTEKDTDGDKLLYTESIEISSQNPKTSQSFRFKITNDDNDIQPIYEDESHEFSTLDLNDDGFLDLALRIASGLKSGGEFYYWIFNPKSKKFILTHESIPALKLTSKKELSSETDSSKYVINKNYKLEKMK